MLVTARDAASSRGTRIDVFGLGLLQTDTSGPDIDPSEFFDGPVNELKTSIPGVTGTTRLADADADELEAVPRIRIQFQGRRHVERQQRQQRHYEGAVAEHVRQRELKYIFVSPTGEPDHEAAETQLQPDGDEKDDGHLGEAGGWVVPSARWTLPSPSVRSIRRRLRVCR